MTEDVTMVLCIPVTAMPQGDTQAGSQVRWCMICGEPVWCALNTLRQLEADPKMLVWCNPCGVPLVEAEREKKLLMVPGDRRSPREVRAAWRMLRRKHGREGR